MKAVTCLTERSECLWNLAECYKKNCFKLKKKKNIDLSANYVKINTVIDCIDLCELLDDTV